MVRHSFVTAFVSACWIMPACLSAQTLYTTHFFDWYRVTEQLPYESHQKAFTFRPDWEGVGLKPEEMGVTQRYYTVQFRMIHEAGFDGIHYEWFGQQPSQECVAALRECGMKVAMFYDQEIRFQSQPAFIKPTDAFVATVINDVGSFYDRIPRDLWLIGADGAVPLIFYGYQFDQSVRSAEAWHSFYARLLSGLRERLGVPVRIYWTDCGALCQTYAFQHFPEISCYSFGWWGGQRQIAARSVTFVCMYDDRGAVAGGRAARTAVYDHRFLEEHLQLARRTRPDLVFHYGWNEYYEGENIFPDRTWGDWRYRVMSAIVGTLKAARPAPYPPAVVLADDLYIGDLEKPGSREAEATLLGAYRYLFPQADTRLGMQLDRLPSGKPIVVAMTRRRSDEDEAKLLSLADSGRACVVFYEPDPSHNGPLVRRFAAGKRTRPMARYAPPPSNQWVGAEIPVDVDAAKYPFLRIRVQNSPNTFYHVRVIGTTDAGESFENHDMNSPLDWKATGGETVERREDMKRVLEAYAGKPIARFTGLVVIVNATVIPGDFTATFSHAEFCDAEGNVGYRVPLGDPSAVRYRASFTNTGLPGFPTGSMEPGGSASRSLKLSLKARFASDIPVDSVSQAFTFQPGVQALAWSAWPPRSTQGHGVASVRVPLVLRRGNLYWVNTLSSHPSVYQPLMKALGMPPVRVAEHTLFQQVGPSTSIQNPKTPTVLGRDPLPVPVIRYVHPADIKLSVSYPWPKTKSPLAAVRKNGSVEKTEAVTAVVSRTEVTPSGTLRLNSGDVVDVFRVPVKVVPTAGPVQVRAISSTPATFQVDIRGRGSAKVSPLTPGVSISRDGTPVGASVRLPCRLQVVSPPSDKQGEVRR